MRGMRREYKKVYRVVHAERDHIGRDVTPVAVHDQ